MKTKLLGLVAALTLLPSICLAQDYNVQCYDPQGAGLYFVGNGSYGAALFFDEGYAVTQDYNTVINWGPNVTVYQANSAVLMIWATGRGQMVWSYPQGQRNYTCD